MNENARQEIVEAYFDGIAAKDMSRVRWAQTATLRTPLNPAGGERVLIRGREAILRFFGSILPAVRSVKFLRYYTSESNWVAGQAEIGLANSNTLYVLDAFLVKDGEKPDKFLRPHGMILRFDGFCIFMEDYP